MKRNCVICLCVCVCVCNAGPGHHPASLSMDTRDSFHCLVNKANWVHNFFLACLFLFSTCFGRICAHYQRKNCIYATLGTCYSVWMTVWGCMPVIHTSLVLKGPVREDRPPVSCAEIMNASTEISIPIYLQYLMPCLPGGRRGLYLYVAEHYFI